MNELNGTSVVLITSPTVGGDPSTVIFGQLEITSVTTGTPIDISNKSFGDFVTLLDGSSASNGFTVTCNFIANTATSYKQMRDRDRTRLIYPYIIEWGAYRKKFFAMVSAVSDTAPHGDAASCSVTLQTSGPFEDVVGI